MKPPRPVWQVFVRFPYDELLMGEYRWHWLAVLNAFVNSTSPFALGAYVIRKPPTLTVVVSPDRRAAGESL